MKNYLISCRRTKMGASTRTVVLREPAEVRAFNTSRTGRHWEEEVVLGEGGVVFVEDISNSGKHRCYVLGACRSLEEAEEQFGDLPCGLPARLHG